MSAVDRIIERCRITIREFEAFASQHRDLLGRYENQDVNDSNYSWWLASLADEDDRVITRFRRDQIKAMDARRTLETWGVTS